MRPTGCGGYPVNTGSELILFYVNCRDFSPGCSSVCVNPSYLFDTLLTNSLVSPLWGVNPPTVPAPGIRWSWSRPSDLTHGLHCANCDGSAKGRFLCHRAPRISAKKRNSGANGGGVNGCGALGRSINSCGATRGSIDGCCSAGRSNHSCSAAEESEVDCSKQRADFNQEVIGRGGADSRGVGRLNLGPYGVHGGGL